MKKLFIFSMIVLLLAITPIFGHELNNDTIDYDETVLTAGGDVYFDSNVLNDGDGSINNPYKFIKTDRINNYNILHLANGQYDLQGSKTISTLTIVGEDSDRTVLRHDGVIFTVTNTLTLQNLTLSGACIENQGIIRGSNVIFENGNGCEPDRYQNTFGGAIDNYGTVSYTPKLYLDNCNFKNNYAEYGGAIYLFNSEAYITNSVFDRNIAYNYGGAIACDGEVILDIRNTAFRYDSSQNDIGGALYIRDSQANLENCNFSDCNSTFGGAIADLNSATTINSIISSYNSALYSGGSVYKIYGTLSVKDSKFSFNSADNGGALFVDNATYLIIDSNRFTYNSANNYGGAIYSLYNKNSTFSSNINNRNRAKYENNIYETDSINLFIGNGNYTAFRYNQTYTESLPSNYSLVDAGYVTPVKDQQTSGNCWAFSALAALESCILKAANTSYDLSEENLKNLIELYSDYGWNMAPNEGGYDEMGIGYLVSWLGPILESDDLFDDYSTISPVLNSVMHVQNVLFLGRNSYTDNDRIKQAILDYGGVATGIYFDNSYLFGDSYYYPYSKNANHAVTIVGWDDNYPYYNFGNTPSGNGAWLVKNSWGTSWGNKGYFYVSYYDTRFAQVGDSHGSYTFILNDTLKFDKNYQYDIIGLTDYFMTGKKTIWYKNSFNSTGDELLAAFSTYFNDRTNWTAYIYVNGNLKHTQNGISQAGYYTINLDKFIQLKTGDTFEIQLKINSESYANFPISEKIMATKMIYTPGISYFSEDGIEWYDLFNYRYSTEGHTYNSQVACIKAFTILPKVSIQINSISAYVGDTFNITAQVSGINNGTLTFYVNGQRYNASINNGLASFEISFDKSGNYTIESSYMNNEICSNIATGIIAVRDKLLDTTLLLEDYVTKVNDNLLVNIRVIDSNNDPVKNGNISITINGIIRSKEVENGTASFELAFDESGNYTLNASFSGKDYESSVSSSTISVNKLKSSVTLDITAQADGKVTILAKVYDENNMAINDGNVTFHAKSLETQAIVKDGIATLNLELEAGNYTLTAIFNGKNYESSAGTATIKIDKKEPVIDISIADITYDEDLIVKIISPDAGNLNLTINSSHKYLVTDGIFKVPDTLNAGIYTATLTFNGNDKYSPKTISTTFKIGKKDLECGFNITGTTIEITLSQTINDIAEASIGNNEYKVRLTNGVGYLNISKLAVGDYTLNINYDNPNYMKLNEDFSFNIPKTKTGIISSDISMYYHDGTRFEIALIDENKNQLANRSVIISIGGVDYNRTTDNNGKTSIAINLNSGSYDISVLFNGDEKYAPCNVTNSITIKSTVESKDLVKYYRNGTQFSAKILDLKGNPVKNTRIEMNINGVLYYRSSDENGVVGLNINLNPDDYIITVLNPITDEMISNNVQVLSNLVENRDIVKYYRNGTQYSVKLLDDRGNPLGGKNITFNINGLFYTRVTGEDGVCQLNINLQSGDYIITGEYNGLRVSNRIKVLSVIETGDLTMNYRDGTQFKAKILNGQGKANPNQKVTFNINGVFYNRLTDDDGVAGLNINLISGKYIITTTYEGLNEANTITIY